MRLHGACRREQRARIGCGADVYRCGEDQSPAELRRHSQRGHREAEDMVSPSWEGRVPQCLCCGAVPAGGPTAYLAQPFHTPPQPCALW